MEEKGKLDIEVEKKLDTVEDYKFEPIKGYPMLHWKGKRPFNSTQFYPAQLKENYGEEVNGWINKIFWGDNLQVMSHLLKEYRGKLDLIYIDPPFDSKANYKKKIALKGKQLLNDINSFEEKQYTDIWNNDDYLQFIYDRLILLRELLSDKGSIWFHCDYHRAHHIRSILEEVFGSDRYVNEVIWKRQTAHSDYKQGAKHLGRIHDTIYLFSKTSDFTLNTLFTPYEKQYVDKNFRYKDKDGRNYSLGDITGPGGAAKGNPKYEFLGVTRYWAFSEQNMHKMYKKGEVIQTKPGTVPRRKRYLDQMPGISLQSIWTDINSVQSQSKEKTNYPTQKPFTLLERIILSSSNPGDIVFDCFMGSGTTQEVSMKLGRKFIGADINLGAIETTIKRLNKAKTEIIKKKPVLEYENEDGEKEKVKNFYTGFSVNNVNNYDIFRNPIQAKEILKQALEVQPLPNNTIYDGEKDGRMVKIMPVNRIATKADLNELITGFNYKSFEKKSEETPNKAVESLLLVCMGHEPDLAASLQKEVPYKLEIEVVDILRDKANLEFKRDSEAEVVIEEYKLIIKQFYPMNLLQKLSLMKENVEDWKELTETVKIDFNYDGSIFEPTVVDVPEKNEMVAGEYEIPEDAGTIRIKITDLLSESLELTLDNN
jgi:DNA modification methylase